MLQRRLVFFVAAVTMALGTSLAMAATTGRFVGSIWGNHRMSFSVSSDGRYVTHFRLVEECSGVRSDGTRIPMPVPGRMRIRNGRFSRHGVEFTIVGRLTGARATGTARDVDGKCVSDTLAWHARAK